MKILAPFALLILLIGCSTTPSGSTVTKEVHFRTLNGWAQDLELVSVTAVVGPSRDEVSFAIRYKSGAERSLSFFDPPNGDSIKYVTKGVHVGEGVIGINGIAVKDLKAVKEITLGFGGDTGQWSFASLNYYDIKRLIE